MDNRFDNAAAAAAAELEAEEAMLARPLDRALEAAPPVAQPLAHASPSRIWKIGTLTYTLAGLVLLFVWLLFGDFAISLRDRSVGPVVQLMLNGFHSSNFTMAVLLSVIPTALSMVLSPMVSYKSDRLRSRWGRRIPFLLIPTPIAALSMIGLAFTPHIATFVQRFTGYTDAGRHIALLATFAVFWTCFEIAAVVAGAVMGGLIADVVPRPVVGRFYGLFRAVSLIDGMIFNWYLMGHAEQHFTGIFVGVALVFGIGFTLMCLNVKEGHYPPPDTNSDDPRAGGFAGAVRVYFRECFSSPHYLWIFAATAAMGAAAVPINAWSILYAKQLNVGLGNWDAAGLGIGQYRLGYGGIMTLTYLCSLCLAYVIGSLVDRLHALRVTIAAVALYGTACLLSYLFIRDQVSFSAGLLAHGVLSGTIFTAAAALPQFLLPREKFAQFASAGVLASQIVMLPFNLVLGKVLDWTNSDYRITFAISAGIAFLAVALLINVYIRISRMGGVDGHAPPLPAQAGRGFPVVVAGSDDTGAPPPRSH